MTTQTAELTARVGQLIADVLYVEVDAPGVDLIESGLIDSLALVSLITEIEHEFGIQLPLDDFDVDRFRSVQQIAAAVAATAPQA
ncbi:MAG TPA: phosphopantetheine-binding protein [Conexibacter sp.]|nr:phosphopantetheine-binding protein [Conexibacter sp.]